MNKKLLSLAKRNTPASIRIGLDVDILDLKALEVEYRSNGNTRYGLYQNAVMCMKLKHRNISTPFWINVFCGAQSIDNDICFVNATWDCQITGKLDEIGVSGTLYQEDGIDPNTLEEGSESLSEIILAFEDYFISDDDSIIDQEMFHIHNLAEAVKDINYIVIDMEISRNFPEKKDVQKLIRYSSEVTTNFFTSREKS
jgi:hypothetical protein